MRRPNFLVAALATVLTFAALTAFVRRPWGWHRGWRHYYCQGDDRYWDRSAAPLYQRQAPITDTTPLR